MRCLFVAAGVLCAAQLVYAQSLPPAALKVLYHFGASDTNSPTGELVQGSDGTLYGVLAAGGTFGQGSVFKLDSAGQFQTLYSFGSGSTQTVPPDGAYPGASLIFGSDGNLYGTTTQGGPNLGGTIFKMTVAGEITTLVAFAGSPPVLGLLAGRRRT